MKIKFIIYCFFSISIAFIVNKALICFIMRFSSLISLSLFRFKTNNYNIKETRIFSYIDAEIDDCINDVSI